MKSRTTGSIIAMVLAAVGAGALVVSRPLAVETAYPLERAGLAWRQSVWPRIAGVFRGGAAQAENVRLRRELAQLQLLRRDNERLKSDNDRLRRALGYVARSAETWVAAGVLSQGGGAVGSDTVLRIDKGSLDGVRQGAVAAVPEGLVGRVASVTPHTAEIRLLTDGSLKVACEVEGGGKIAARGILAGGGDGVLALKYLQNAESASPHSRVFTSGRGGVFPRGLEIGTLLGVRKNQQNGLLLEGEVLPSVAFSTLEDVFIRRER